MVKDKKGFLVMYVLGKRSRNNLSKVSPTLRLIIEEAIKFSPYDFTITDGFRTTEEQQKLYAKGRTIKKYFYKGQLYKQGIVTQCDGVKNKSNHQFGEAVDFYIYENGSVNTEADIKKVIAVAKHILKVGKKYYVKLGWGGNWKKKDYPHIELKK